METVLRRIKCVFEVIKQMVSQICQRCLTLARAPSPLSLPTPSTSPVFSFFLLGLNWLTLIPARQEATPKFLSGSAL
jgi:hypothetical protein